MEEYMKLILRKLQCSRGKKAEIDRDLRADIQDAMENGESWEEIRERMGEPEDIAREFNDNFSDEELRAGKRKKILCMTGIVVLLSCLAIVMAVLIIPRILSEDRKGNQKPDSTISATEEPGKNQDDKTFSSEAVTSYTDYDEDEVIKQTKLIISLLDEGDYDTIREQYTADIMKSTMKKATLEPAKQSIGDNWGALVSYGRFYTAGVKQDGKNYIVVQINVAYEQVSVMYTITFDEEMKLAGLYIK